MLLKFIFTILAILWLYQALSPLLTSTQSSRPKTHPPPKQDDQGAQKSRFDDEGEYIDYEEID